MSSLVALFYLNINNSDWEIVKRVFRFKAAFLMMILLRCSYSLIDNCSENVLSSLELRNIMHYCNYTFRIIEEISLMIEASPLSALQTVAVHFVIVVSLESVNLLLKHTRCSVPISS